ncbi:MAG: hypothetical protein PSX81_06725 [bacterium]|nr:hypothetical protein [bacterium]
MKTVLYIELVLLAIVDMLFIFSLTEVLSVRSTDLITLVNFFIGPLQFSVAIFLCFNVKNWSQHFLIYLALAILTIAILLINVNYFHFSYHDSVYLGVMFFDFALAHYFIYVLFDLSRLKITKQFS